MNQRKWSLTALMDKLTDFVGGIMFLGMVSVTGYNVLSYWLTGRRYGQLEEVAISCLVWISYISLGQHYREKKCIRADLVSNLIPEKCKKPLEFISDVIVFIIAAVVFYFGIRLMMRSTNKYTSVLKICYVWIDLGLVIGFFTLLYNLIYKYIPHKKETREKEKEEA